MGDLKWTKPATALCSEPAYFEQLGGPLDISHTPSPIVAQLIGSDTAVANGIKATGAFDLCRRLIAAGVNPDAGLVCTRDGIVALRIRAIGTGAKYTIRETAMDGPRVVRWKAFQPRDVTAPMRQTA